MTSTGIDEFYYARNHAAGPGEWCVRGPNFEMAVPDKMLAYAIGKLLSGKTEDAASMVEDWKRFGMIAPISDEHYRRLSALKRIPAFLAENLLIEGITRVPTLDEIKATETFLALGKLDVNHLITLQMIYAPGNPLRCSPGMDVRVGNYTPPRGSPAVYADLQIILRDATFFAKNAWRVHVDFEMLHPFMDGNGRVGRTLWAWAMLQNGEDPFALPFLHKFYFQTLANQERS